MRLSIRQYTATATQIHIFESLISFVRLYFVVRILPLFLLLLFFHRQFLSSISLSFVALTIPLAAPHHSREILFTHICDFRSSRKINLLAL